MKKWGSADRDPSTCIHPNEWMSHFQSLLNDGPAPSPSLIEELENYEQCPMFSELDVRISDEEILKAFRKLNTKASPGVDKIPGELLDAGKKYFLPAYSLILNKIFSNASYPVEWSKNFLKTIYKKSESWDPNNYRGIAIGASFAKSFSLILLERLEDRIEKTHPISSNQIGFRKNHRTADHIFVLQTIIKKIVKVEKRKLYVAFIDFQKAYDKINRTLLFLKLQRLGISGLFYKNIKAIYEQVSYLVKVDGGHLDPISSRIGLKQGGVLSPLLFNIYIDDIKYIFDDTCSPVNVLERPISHLLYADDLVLISNTSTGLNNCLNKLAQFCDKWLLEVNIKKSKVIIFNQSGRILGGQRFNIQGTRLEVVQTYCYLGIDMTAMYRFI